MPPPQINDNGEVAWTASDNRVYLYTGSGPKQIISTTSTNNQDLQINNNGWVVWVGKDDNSPGDYEIYLYKGSGAPENLSNNSYNDGVCRPTINDNGWVFWGSDNAVYYLYNDSEVINVTVEGNFVDVGHYPQINDSGTVAMCAYKTGPGNPGYNAAYYDSTRSEDVSNSLPTRLGGGLCNVNSASPRINSLGQIVWGGGEGVFLANPLTLTQVTNNTGAFDVVPQILDDGRILWQGWDGHDYEIYCQVPGQSPTQLTNNDSPDVMPQMNASGQLVWMNWDGQDWEVWYNLGSGPVQLTNNTGFDVLPQITADAQIYWQGWDGHDYEIYHYNPATQVTTQLTDNSLPDAAPRVNDSGKITWMGFDGQDWEIWDDIGQGPVQLTNNTGNDLEPQIGPGSQPTIGWYGWDGNDFEVYTYNNNQLLDPAYRTDNTVDDIYPTVMEGGVMVWSQWDGQDFEICQSHLWTGGNSGFPRFEYNRITDDEYDDLRARINAAGQIVWQKWDGQDYEIYAYK